MRKIPLLMSMLVCLCSLAFGQAGNISGQIKDEAGTPIAYATVKVKNSSTGSSADAQGRYRINAKTGDVLVFSAIGYGQMELAVGSAATLDASLKTTEGLIDEVIVTAQGIRRRPRELGYSVAKVSEDEITVGRSPQLAQGLSGKVSGLAVFNVNNSVDPAVKIVLRGYRSMTGNNDALVVIDGLPLPAGSATMLNLINPNDIASVSVLKGGQAATLYGSDGVNGALVITTKRGSKGKAKVSYSNSTNIEKVSFLPDFQDKFGSGSHYANGFGTAGYKTDYLARMKDNWRSYENQQFGDQFDGSLRPAGRLLEDGTYYELPYSAVDDVRKKIWNTGVTTNNQLSVSGGNETSTFYLSLENNLAEGVVPSDKSKRTGVRFAGTTEAGRLKAGINLAYVQANYDRTTFDFYNESINQAAHIPLYDLKDWKTNKFASPDAYYNDYFTNPYFLLDNNRQNYGDANFQGNVELNYKIADWLNLYNKLGVMQNTRNRKETVGKYNYTAFAKTGATVPAAFDQDDGAGITRTVTDIAGSVLDRTETENIINNEFQIQANKDFGDFSTRGLVGFSLYDRRTRLVEVSSASIVVPDIYNVGNRQGELSGREEFTQYRKYGYYADLLVGWKDMVFLHGSGRFDGTSKFYKPERKSSLYTYPYYGVDVSLNVTEIFPAIKNNILNYAKIRAGYSENVADNIPIYGLDRSFPNSAGFPYGNQVGITVGNLLPASDLEPEKVGSFEVGAELQLFDNRINVDFTYYTQKTTGSVVAAQLPQSSGYNQLRLNIGETKNWGYETDIKAQVIKSGKFSWDLSVRYSYNDNKVIDIYPGLTEFQLAGGFSYAGSYVTDNVSFPRVKAVGYIRDPATNRVIVNKTTGYPIATGPLKDLGRALPKDILGWGTKLAYGSLTLTANFEYRGGNVIFSDLGRQMTFTGSGGWTEDRAPHVFPNSAYDDGTGKFVPNTNVNVQEAEYSLWVDYYRLIGENFTVPAWFIKMRDINLAVSVPQKWLGKTKFIADASLAVYGRNLFTIVDSMNDFVDPEFSSNTGNGLGISNTLQTPPVKQFGVNLNITFK